MPGADVNPYLAIAGLLASARDGIADGTDPGEPLVGEDWEREVPRPARASRARPSAPSATASGPPRRSAPPSSAHYAEAGRWEWERFLAADVVTEWERARYFEVI